MILDALRSIFHSSRSTPPALEGWTNTTNVRRANFDFVGDEARAAGLQPLDRSGKIVHLQGDVMQPSPRLSRNFAIAESGEVGSSNSMRLSPPGPSPIAPFRLRRFLPASPAGRASDKTFWPPPTTLRLCRDDQFAHDGSPIHRRSLYQRIRIAFVLGNSVANRVASPSLR